MEKDSLDHTIAKYPAVPVNTAEVVDGNAAARGRWSPVAIDKNTAGPVPGIPSLRVGALPVT